MGSRICSLIVVLVVFAASYAIAAEEAPQADRSPATQLPEEMPEIEKLTLVHADSMTVTRQKDRPQVLEGAVDIILSDKTGQETRIRAEKMSIYYQQDLRTVQKIETEGRVKISRGPTVATTELAIYRGDKRTIELLIDPHVTDSRGELSANRITINMDSDEVVAEGNVRGVVYPEAFGKETSQ